MGGLIVVRAAGTPMGVIHIQGGPELSPCSDRSLPRVRSALAQPMNPSDARQPGFTATASGMFAKSMLFVPSPPLSKIGQAESPPAG